MSLFKFSFLVITFVFSFTSNATFTDAECLNSSFSTEVKHKGQPFGLTENKLFVDKQLCVLTISHEKMKYMKKKWVIDVCRGPVHIKEDAGNIDVYKREKGCATKSSGEYCKTFTNIKNIIQDDGLIFADGEKEDLATDHGRVYCSFLLVKKYLGEGIVFSKDGDFSGVLFSTRKSSIKKGATEVAPINNQDDGPADF